MQRDGDPIMTEQAILEEDDIKKILSCINCDYKMRPSAKAAAIEESPMSAKTAAALA